MSLAPLARWPIPLPYAPPSPQYPQDPLCAMSLAKTWDRSFSVEAMLPRPFWLQHHHIRNVIWVMLDQSISITPWKSVANGMRDGLLTRHHVTDTSEITRGVDSKAAAILDTLLDIVKL